MLKFFLLAFLSLVLTTKSYAQENVSLLSEDLKQDATSQEQNKDNNDETEPTTEKNNSLLEFMGIKIPDFIPSSSKSKDENSISVLTKKAESGDVEAQLKLGYAYLYGVDELEIDYNKALHYYEMAANQNNKLGLNNLGTLYYNGLGTKRNPRKAAMLFAKSSELGNFDAATNLGFMYLSGNGIEQNIALAIEYFEKAAQENILAKFMVGCAYSRGRYRPINHVKASPLFKEVADAGFDEAQVLTANAYMNGLGYPQNYTNAVKYLRKAVAQGNISAMMQLADIYASGHKYPANISGAHILYNLASVRGVAGAEKLRKKVESKMKIEEILTAQQDADQYQEKPSQLTTYVHSTIGSDLCSYIK